MFPPVLGVHNYMLLSLKFYYPSTETEKEICTLAQGYDFVRISKCEPKKLS